MGCMLLGYHTPGVPYPWGAALLGCCCSLWLLRGLESGLTSAPSAWLPCDPGAPRSYARGNAHVCDPEACATFTAAWPPPRREELARARNQKDGATHGGIGDRGQSRHRAEQPGRANASPRPLAASAPPRPWRLRADPRRGWGLRLALPHAPLRAERAQGGQWRPAVRSRGKQGLDECVLETEEPAGPLRVAAAGWAGDGAAWERSQGVGALQARSACAGGRPGCRYAAPGAAGRPGCQLTKGVCEPQGGRAGGHRSQGRRPGGDGWSGEKHRLGKANEKGCVGDLGKWGPQGHQGVCAGDPVNRTRDSTLFPAATIGQPATSATWS